MLLEILGVGVRERHDVALQHPQGTPHRVALAARRTELAGEIVLLHHGQTRGGRDLRGAVARGSVDHEHLVQQPRIAQAPGVHGDRPDRRRNVAGGQYQADRGLLRGQQSRQRELLGPVGTASTPRRARQVTREPARGAPVRARRRAHAYRHAAMDRDAPPRQLALERLVLEGGAGRQSAAVPVGLCRETERSAAELMVLGDHPLQRRSAREHRVQALASATISLATDRGRQLVRLGAVKLDRSTDRACATVNELELRGQPVLGDDAVRVGAGDQSVRSQQR